MYKPRNSFAVNFFKLRKRKSKKEQSCHNKKKTIENKQVFQVVFITIGLLGPITNSIQTNRPGGVCVERQESLKKYKTKIQ